MFLPEWLNYSRSENAATAMFRGLRGISANWGELIATAETIMSIYEDRLIPEMVERLYDYESTSTLPLVAASRILDTASQAPSGLPEEDRTDLGLSAAVAFGMYGNFPSAKAVIQRIRRSNLEISSSIAAIVATSSPELLPEMLQYCDTNSPSKLYFELLENFLHTGVTTNIEEIRQALIECLLAAPSSFENSLFRSCRLCLEHIFNLSLVRVVREFCNSLPEAYINQLVDKGIRILLPPQFKAIVHHNLPLREGNALISLPTSTGKTLLGELCLVTALQQKPGIVCYLAPYVALGNQVAQTLQEHLPKQYRIKRLIGGYRQEESLNPDINREVVVATPERLDALLRISPNLISYIRCVVCDEAHGIQNDVRGIRLEGILTRLRLLQMQENYDIRLILLSAVLTEYEALKNWMQISDDAVITDTWKPTARRLTIWKEDGKLTWYVGEDPIRLQSSHNESKLGEVHLPWIERGFHSTSHLKNYQKKQEIRKQKQRVNKNVAYLVDFLLQTYEPPVLCVCATKADTRKLAVALADRFPELDPLPEKIALAISQIESYHRSLKPLGETLKHGVAFHNATVPHKICRLIEQAIKSKEIIGVAATTTLAEGVDLPFRFTIIVDWLTWQGQKLPQPMPSLLLKNIAGRCGRAGIFTEGDTIIFDNPIADDNDNYTRPYDYRAKIQKQRFLVSNPDDAELTSAVEDIFTTSLREKKLELKSVLASQFMASIPENPTTENLEKLFSRSLFATYKIGSNSQTNEILNEIRASLEDETQTQGALARASSPLRLTDFGEQANKTGFSPDSCRSIVSVLKGPYSVHQLTLINNENNNLTSQIVATASKLIRKLGTLPEQSFNDLKKLLNRKRVNHLRVKPDDFEIVLEMWLQGEYEEIIFSNLPAVKRSKARGRPKISQWVEGVSEISDWDDEFDKFTEFISAVFVNFLPWLMRACDYLSTISQGWSTNIDWQEWADMIEKGVNSKWSLTAIDQDAPVSRKALFRVSSALPSDYLTEVDPLGIASIKNDLIFKQQVESIFLNLVGQFNNSEALRNEIIALYKWLWEQANLPVRDIFEV